MTQEENTRIMLEALRTNFIESTKLHIQSAMDAVALSYACRCGVNSEKIYREDCYHHFVHQDMGAQIHCCAKEEGLGNCPCTMNCKNYISNEEVSRIIGEYQRNKEMEER